MGLLTAHSPKTNFQKSASFPHPGEKGNQDSPLGGVSENKKFTTNELGSPYLTEDPSSHSDRHQNPHLSPTNLHKKFPALPPAAPCPICHCPCFWLPTFDVRGAKPICDGCRSSKQARLRRMVGARLLAVPVTGDGGCGGEGEASEKFA